MSDLIGVNGALKDVRAKEANALGLTGGNRRFAVEVPVVGYGLITTQIWFPALFVEKPLYNWGFEIASNASIPSIPDARAMVRSWNFTIMEESKVALYKGCRVMFQVSEPYGADGSDQNFAFSMFFEGPAINEPVEEP